MNEPVNVEWSVSTTEYVPDLTDITMDQLLDKEHADSELARLSIENFSHQVICILHEESIKHPAMVKELDDLKNRLQVLMGLPENTPGVNPLTNQRQEAFSEPTGESVEKTPPVDKTSSLVKSMCKDLYRKLTRLTHPDRTKDTNLSELFPSVKNAMKALDLNMLTQLLDSVLEYKESRSTQEKFRRIKLQALKKKREIKDHYLGELSKMQNSLVGTLVLGDKKKRSQHFILYMELVKENIINEIKKLEAIKRSLSTSFYQNPTSYTVVSSTGNF